MYYYYCMKLATEDETITFAASPGFGYSNLNVVRAEERFAEGIPLKIQPASGT